MAVKGTIAKENVVKKIIEALGDDYIGEFDKKYFCWADDGTGKIQVSIALTCPKIYRGVEETTSPEMNFDDDEAPAAEPKGSYKPADITQEEQDTLADLMARLGL